MGDAADPNVLKAAEEAAVLEVRKKIEAEEKSAESKRVQDPRVLEINAELRSIRMQLKTLLMELSELTAQAEEVKAEVFCVDPINLLLNCVPLMRCFLFIR